MFRSMVFMLHVLKAVSIKLLEVSVFLAGKLFGVCSLLNGGLCLVWSCYKEGGVLGPLVAILVCVSLAPTVSALPVGLALLMWSGVSAITPEMVSDSRMEGEKGLGLMEWGGWESDSSGRSLIGGFCRRDQVVYSFWYWGVALVTGLKLR